MFDEKHFTPSMVFAFRVGLTFLLTTAIADEFTKSQILSYYLCLLKREQGAKENPKFSPIPIVVLDGTIAVLPCIDCWNPVKPKDYYANKRYTWHYQLWGSNAKYIKVPVSKSRDIMSGFYENSLDHTLVAIGVNDSSFSGEYFCVAKNGLVLSSYHLDIVPSDPLKMLLPGEAEPETINEPYGNIGVEVLTEWSVWSSCNQCGVIAERRRYGRCVVKKLNLEGATPLSELTAELFRRYPTGVPCRFTWSPMEVQNLEEVYKRPNYLQVENCKFYCVTQPPIRLITERVKGVPNYRIIEKVKRYRYSVREPVPALPPRVLRLVRNTDASDGLALYCPKFDKETYWKKGDKLTDQVTLTASTLNKLTNDRIYVDENGNLVFSYLEGDDEGMYSCWNSDGVLLMTATVNVAEPAKDALIKTGLVLTGVLIVCAAGIYIIWASFKMKRA